MDYGDILRRSGPDNDERIKLIEEIYDLFKINSDDISKACDDAGVRYPDEVLQYYFLARCISARDQLETEGDEMGLTTEDIYDMINETADQLVPYQTYVIWSLWVEFGYETDAYYEMGLEPSLDNLENVAQVQLMHYAERILLG